MRMSLALLSNKQYRDISPFLKKKKQQQQNELVEYNP